MSLDLNEVKNRQQRYEKLANYTKFPFHLYSFKLLKQFIAPGIHFNLI